MQSYQHHVWREPGRRGEQAPGPAAARVREGRWCEYATHGTASRGANHQDLRPPPEMRQSSRKDPQVGQVGAGMPTFRSQQVGCVLSCAQGRGKASTHVRARPGCLALRCPCVSAHAPQHAAGAVRTADCKPNPPSPAGKVRGSPPSRASAYGRMILGGTLRRAFGTRARTREQEEPCTRGITGCRIFCMFFPQHVLAVGGRGGRASPPRRHAACGPHERE